MHDRISRRRFLSQTATLTSSLAGAGLLPFAGQPMVLGADDKFDLLITGGTVVDGTGAARYRADVGIRAGKIAEIGDAGSATAAEMIDARGKIVSPGFIDMHTHSDRTLLADGTAQSAIRQGATTHVIGNCGSSPAPRNEHTGTGKLRYRTYGEYLETLKTSGTSINICGLVGHNTVRSTVMGVQDRPPTEVEMRKMKDWVAEAMDHGAVGMSTGLVTPPGTYSTTEEIIELARVVAQKGGVYASHMRGEASTLIDSVREALRIGREADIRVEISHHKAAGKENWGKTRTTLPMVEAANREGVRARVDVYPYRAGSAGLSQLVPPWAHEGGSGEMLSRLQNASERKRIAHDMTVGTENWPNFFVIDWNDIRIADVAGDANRPWVGKSVGDLARDRGCAGVDACIDLLIEERGRVQMINFIMDEREVQGVLKHPLSLIGSDGTAVSATDRQGKPHPRYYGCFPRVLGHYCRDLELFTLETAIRKMTSMPAEQLALADRGVLKVGNAADVVVFDFDTIIDKATFEDPHQYPAGISEVIVNGQVVVQGDQHRGLRPGQVIGLQQV